MDQELQQALESGITSGVMTAAPFIAGAVVLFLILIYKDAMDSLVSAFFFALGKDMGVGKSLKWRGREGKITKIGGLMTNMRMRDTKLIQRIPNHLLRKEPYEISPSGDDFAEAERLDTMEGKIEEIYAIIVQGKEGEKE